MIGGAGVREQKPDLEWMENERGSVAAKLARMYLFRVLDGGESLW
jgi:hypothetical protein